MITDRAGWTTEERERWRDRIRQAYRCLDDFFRTADADPPESLYEDELDRMFIAAIEFLRDAERTLLQVDRRDPNREE